MLERRAQKVILEEGLGGIAFELLDSIAAEGEKGWGTNDGTLVEAINKCYVPRGIVHVDSRCDDQLDPPEFYVVTLTPLGYAVRDALSGKKVQQ